SALERRDQPPGRRRRHVRGADAARDGGSPGEREAVAFARSRGGPETFLVLGKSLNREKLVGTKSERGFSLTCPCPFANIGIFNRTQPNAVCVFFFPPFNPPPGGALLQYAPEGFRFPPAPGRGGRRKKIRDGRPAPPRLYLVDAMSNIHRAYHAIQRLSTVAG